MTCLTAYEAACVYCRIGWLKIFNPMKPEGSYELDVSLWEERMIVKTLCTLATNEPGENWPCFSYRYSDNNNTPAEIIPGWSLTSLWLQDHAMPQRGVLSLLFYTGDGNTHNLTQPSITPSNPPFQPRIQKDAFCLCY